MSIGVRFIDNTFKVREEFLGFVEIQTLNAVGVASSILELTDKFNIDMTKLVGLGFDGCSTMNGKENGFWQLLEKISFSLFFSLCFT